MSRLPSQSAPGYTFRAFGRTIGPASCRGARNSSPDTGVTPMGPNEQNGDQGGTDEQGGAPRREQARAAAEKMIGQLQVMIDQAGKTAGPVLRDVAAKAAELAAVAAQNAGPVAHMAADVT